MSCDSWDMISRLDKANARHLRRGIRLGEVPAEYILGHAREELEELAQAPDDVDEMADTLACLIHYCVRKGWSKQQVEEAIAKKLRLRVDMEDVE